MELLSASPSGDTSAGRVPALWSGTERRSSQEDVAGVVGMAATFLCSSGAGDVTAAASQHVPARPSASQHVPARPSLTCGPAGLQQQSDSFFNSRRVEAAPLLRSAMLSHLLLCVSQTGDKVQGSRLH